MRKFFQKKTNRLSAAEARAIPTDDKYLDPIMDKIYKEIHFAASRGKNKIWYRFVGHLDSTRDIIIIKHWLESDGYKVHGRRSDDFAHVGEWLISWEEDE